jgi:hypothetical protein
MVGLLPVFISLRKRVALLYPQALGSLFVASYDSQGYGGGIRLRLHTGQKTSLPLLCVLSLPGKHVPTELFPSSGCCIVACSHSCYLAMGLHVTMSKDNTTYRNRTYLLTYLLTNGAEPFLRSCQLCSHSRSSQHFMEPQRFITVFTRARHWSLS